MLAFVAQLLPLAALGKIIAKKGACFSASSYTNGYSFAAPIAGELYGVELVHQSGGVSCIENSASAAWGCWYDHFGVQLIKEASDTANASVLFPSNTTTNLTNSLGECAPCANGCDLGFTFYQITGGNANRTTLRLIDTENTHYVTENDSFAPIHHVTPDRHREHALRD